jgi:hypothetical protein
MRRVLLGLVLTYVTVYPLMSQPTPDELTALQEFITLDVNSSIQVPGEELWLAVTCKHRNQELSELSKLVYVELIDENGKSVLQHKFQLNKGKGSGQLYLPSTISTGQYRLVAYTRWMKNYQMNGKGEVFIEVVNPFEAIPQQLTNLAYPMQLELSLHSPNQKSLSAYVSDQYYRGHKAQVRIVSGDEDDMIEFFSDQNGFAEVSNTLPSGKLNVTIVDSLENIHFQELEWSGVLHQGTWKYIKSKKVNDQLLQLELDKRQFGLRDSIALRIINKGDDHLTNFTLSVRKIIPGEYWSNGSIPRINDSEIPDEIMELPDLRGDLLVGTAFKNGVPGSKIPIGFASNSSKPAIYFTQTNTRGRFHLIIPIGETLSQPVYMINQTSAEIRIQEPWFEDFSMVKAPLPVLDPDKLQWLKTKSIEIQINNAYYKPSDQLSVHSLTIGQTDLKRYDLDEYVRFPTVEDHIREYVTELWLREVDSRSTFIFPYLDNKSGGVDSVLTLFNGIPVSPGFILRLNPADIQYIDLYEKQILLNDMEFAGIVNFQSYVEKRGKFSFANLEKYDYQDVKQYRSLNSINPDLLENKRIPRYENQLVWLPHVNFEPGITRHSFFSTDSPGIYEICLRGLNSDNALMISTLQFEIK